MNTLSEILDTLDNYNCAYKMSDIKTKLEAQLQQREAELVNEALENIKKANNKRIYDNGDKVYHKHWDNIDKAIELERQRASKMGVRL